jgi:hypothetical protein
MLTLLGDPKLPVSNVPENDEDRYYDTLEDGPEGEGPDLLADRNLLGTKLTGWQ